MFKVAGVCESMGLPYFVTGSVASMFWGESRHTVDVDFVVELPSWKAREFCDHFPEPEFYVSPEAAIEAAQGPAQFNVIEVGEGVRADIIVFAGTPLDESRLARAQSVEFPGSGKERIAAPEDVILKKLEYFKQGGSGKHTRDITSMFRVSGTKLDLAYIEHWSLRLGVKDQWALIKQRLNMS